MRTVFFALTLVFASTNSALSALLDKSYTHLTAFAVPEQSIKTAAAYWLPDWQTGFSNRSDTAPSGSGDNSFDCKANGYSPSPCIAPEIEIRQYNLVTKICYECECPASYKYTSCNTGYVLAGGSCNGKYLRCDAASCPAGYTAGKTCSSGYNREVNGKSGSQDCAKCVAKSCPSGYTAGLANCNGKAYPAGWTYSSNGYSGDSVCGKCTAKNCPAGYTAGVTKCSDTLNWTFGSNGYSGNELCGRCTAIPCSKGETNCTYGCASEDASRREMCGTICTACKKPACSSSFIYDGTNPNYIAYGSDRCEGKTNKALSLENPLGIFSLYEGAKSGYDVKTVSFSIYGKNYTYAFYYPQFTAAQKKQSPVTVTDCAAFKAVVEDTSTVNIKISGRLTCTDKIKIKSAKHIYGTNRDSDIIEFNGGNLSTGYYSWNSQLTKFTNLTLIPDPKASEEFLLGQQEAVLENVTLYIYNNNIDATKYLLLGKIILYSDHGYFGYGPYGPQFWIDDDADITVKAINDNPYNISSGGVINLGKARVEDNKGNIYEGRLGFDRSYSPTLHKLENSFNGVSSGNGFLLENSYLFVLTDGSYFTIPNNYINDLVLGNSSTAVPKGYFTFSKKRFSMKENCKLDGKSYPSGHSPYLTQEL